MGMRLLLLFLFFALSYSSSLFDLFTASSSVGDRPPPPQQCCDSLGLRRIDCVIIRPAVVAEGEGCLIYDTMSFTHSFIGSFIRSIFCYANYFPMSSSSAASRVDRPRASLPTSADLPLRSSMIFDARSVGCRRQRWRRWRRRRRRWRSRERKP